MKIFAYGSFTWGGNATLTIPKKYLRNKSRRPGYAKRGCHYQPISTFIVVDDNHLAKHTER